MSWSGLGWKKGISIIQLQKVEELERSLNKATSNVSQKQMLIDGLNQFMEKLKQKVRYKVIFQVNWIFHRLPKAE